MNKPSTPTPKPPPKASPDDKKDKLAKALRDNLLRRKAAASEATE